MDDFNVSALHESKNEWGSRLITILTPLIIDGYKSILEESIKLCKDNNEIDKYLTLYRYVIAKLKQTFPGEIICADDDFIPNKKIVNDNVDLILNDDLETNNQNYVLDKNITDDESENILEDDSKNIIDDNNGGNMSGDDSDNLSEILNNELNDCSDLDDNQEEINVGV